MGPTFPSDGPTSKDEILGVPSKETDGFVFDFASNCWMLHYLRLTNQWDWDLAKDVFNGMSTYIGQIMLRHSKSGGFKSFKYSKPSVW